MPGSLHLGTIAGIRIDLHFSWLIIVVLLTFSLAVGWFPAAVPGFSAATYWSLGLFATLLLFAAVLAHELAHSLVARARGLPVKRITLFIFGGVSDLEQEPRSPGVEFQMAFVGPFTSLVIGGLAFLANWALGGKAPLLGALLGYLAIMNLLLAGFNLLPGFPLDGGRVLRSILWKVTGNLRKATRWTSLVGQGIGSLLIMAGIFLFFGGDWVDGLWFGFIGWFLLQAAQTAQAQQTLESVFRGVTVGQVMRPIEAAVTPDCSLQRLVDHYILPLGLRAIPVVNGDYLSGLITLGDVRQVPREQWPSTLVSQAMHPVNTLHLATPEQGLQDILHLLARNGINQVPVVEQGRLIGMVSREVIVNTLAIRQDLGLAEDTPGHTPARPEPSHDQQHAALPPIDQSTSTDRSEREQAKWKEPASRP
jgi:Zn-dependent protease/CBS domain-containing protein